MPNTKIAVSIESSLFEKAEEVANVLSVSRSRLYALALAEFIERHENEITLQKINEVLAEGSDPEDSEFLERIRRHQGSILDHEW